MTRDRSPTAAFACWSAEDDDSVRQYAVAFAGAVVNRVTALGAAPYTARDRRAVLDCLAGAGTACWSPAFGTANGFAKLGECAAAPAAGQLFLALAELGFEGEFQANYPFPARHRLGASWLASAKSVRMAASRGSVTVITEDASVTMVFGSEHQGAEIQAGLFGRGWIKWGYSVDPLILDPGDVPLGAELSGIAVAQLRAAADLIAIDPQITRWCSRLLYELSLTNSGNDRRLTSRSTPLQPGNVQISLPGPPLHLAELLVHEAAHQHYFLAALAGPYVAPASQDAVVYSALRECQRPIDRVLLGLHALVNITDFLVLHAEAGGKMGREAIARIGELAPTIMSMQRPFAGKPAVLSDSGRDLLGDGLERLDLALARYAPAAFTAPQEARA